MSFVRQPAVAGMFYPSDPAQLQEMLDTLMTEASRVVQVNIPREINGKPLRELIGLQVPHAGYVYSGIVAAIGYQMIKYLRPQRIVIAGPTHRVGVRGIALSAASAFATPLGEVPVDQEAQRVLEAQLDWVKYYEPSHEQEHSLEVQLPFLQYLMGSHEFSIVPLAVGDCPADKTSIALKTLLEMGESGQNLVIISSDLSHYLPYEEARQLDDRTLNQVQLLEYPLESMQACGAYAFSGMIRLARQSDMKAQILVSGSSGDTAGDKDRVVGYSSVAFWKYHLPGGENNAIPDEYGSHLPGLARRILENYLHERAERPEETVRELSSTDETLETWLDSNGASFVTLTKGGQLRGCIGSLVAHRPLGEDICANALAAALRDPRFPAVTAEELPELHIEVSVLTKPEPLDRRPDESNAEFLSRLRPGIDGVILRCGFNQATFLPQVWEELPDVNDFIAHLMQKAGLRAADFGPDIELETYQVQAWNEP